MTVADNMKQAVRRLQRGTCTIEECERDMDEIITRVVRVVILTTNGDFNDL